MGLLDGVIATAFQRDAEGRSVFCPWGLRGRCYLLTPEQEADLRRFSRTFYGAFFLALIPGAWYLRWWVLLLSAAAIGGLYLKYWLVTRDLRPFLGVIPPVSADDLLRQHASATGRVVLWGILLLSVGPAGWSLWAIATGARGWTTYVVTGSLVGIAVLIGVQLRRAR